MKSHRYRIYTLQYKDGSAGFRVERTGPSQGVTQKQPRDINRLWHIWASSRHEALAKFMNTITPYKLSLRDLP